MVLSDASALGIRRARGLCGHSVGDFRPGLDPDPTDCGDSDPFYAATKAFIAPVAEPACRRNATYRDPAYWSSQLPAEIRVTRAAADPA